METKLEKIKEYLESEAGIITTNAEDETERIIVDNRFELIKKYVNSTENKDNEFYSKLIKLISVYIDKLYDTKINDFPKFVFDINGKLIPQNYDTLYTGDKANLKEANRNLSENLFNYVCEILKNNKDIKLDTETLTRLLNRNPKQFSLSIEVDDYLYRKFDFKKLVKIINKNQLLKKSNISIDSVYQILIDSYQIDNEEVFVELVTPEDFKNNHTKVIELLNGCRPKFFVKITDIIQRNFDEDFDRMTIAKKRESQNFYEYLIIHLLKSNINGSNNEFIHQLLNDPTVSINYDFYCYEYSGQSSLKERLAFSGKRIIIKDLLSRPENIQSCYWDGDYKIQLYRLYAITGEYEKALIKFAEYYNYAYDFSEDFRDGFNEDGYARADFSYRDTLVAFIENICASLIQDNIELSKRNDIINSILNNEKVRYINIDKILPIIKKVLSKEDFETLFNSLMEKYNSSSLNFITVDDIYVGFYNRYVIRMASEEEIKNSVIALNDESKKSFLVRKLTQNKPNKK